jgi:hypothetical protein
MVVKCLPSFRKFIGKKRSSLTLDDFEKKGYGLCSLFDAFDHRRGADGSPERLGDVASVS